MKYTSADSKFKKINNLSIKNAEKLFDIWQASYVIEKNMLGAKVFPPLNRTAHDFVCSTNDFFSIISDSNYLGVIEILTEKEAIHIQSLVVSPAHFRKGVGSKLITTVLNLYDTSSFTVETGFDNLPAKKLYESFEFKMKRVWMTKFGVKKIRYQKIMKSS